ncbi:LPP20 family lipoprotein [Psychromonas sp. MME2]|uniref:LPP20 family lipoprotein n=1 Tax=unclassified Psychromonas TaxID=2614957 RepID=UPI00339C2FDE
MYKKLSRTLIIFISCLFVYGCSFNSAQQRPTWIDNASQDYAAQDYLTAVGQSDKRDRATQNAIANLAEIFLVNVNAQTNTLTEATKQQSALGVSMESSTELRRSIQTETDQVISGVEIKETWLSPEGEYYALAVLNKRKAALSLSESIMDLDQATLKLVEFSRQGATNELASLNALRKARDLQLTRSMANLQLKQVGVSGIESDFSNSKLEQLIVEKLAAIKISVQLDHDGHKRSIQGGLAQLGITVVEYADLQINADIDVTEPTLLDGWYWVRGSYTLSIADKGVMLSHKRWPVKVSAKQKELLIPRLEDNINRQLSNYLIELLSDSPSL